MRFIADALAFDHGQIRQLQIELDRRREQPLLGAVVAHHHGRIDGRVGGDRADGGAVVAVGGEALAGRGQDDSFGFRRGPSHANKCRPTTVDIRGAHLYC